VDDWQPSWKDKQGQGRTIPIADVVSLVTDVALANDGVVQWKHLHFLSTMHAENNGFVEWARPMVYRPGNIAHLTTDRGVCALNSYWWRHVPDMVAFDWPAAMTAVLEWLYTESTRETRGSTVWDWRPLLDWQWHAYGTQRYSQAMPIMRHHVNEELAARGQDPI
jgi:hypothetical protein